jgi:HK97 family phage major capsid protein
MWQRIKALREERGQFLAQMKAVLKKAEDEKRDLTAEETAQFDDLNTKAEQRKADIDRYERAQSLEAELAQRGQPGQQPGRDDTEQPASPFGFEQRDLKGYSLVRAIRLRMNNQPLDGLEKEVSDEIAKRSGKSPQGFFFPTEVALETRDLNLTTGAGAKATVTDPSNFIELLRDRTIVTQLGARLLTGLQGDLSLPKQTGGAQAYWVTEGNAPTASNQTIGQVGLAPKTVGAFTDLSRKFLIQSSVSAEQFVREDLARVLAIAIDKAALNGSGSGAEPQGILQNSNVSTVAIGTNGGAPTFAKIVEMETVVANNNADVGSLAYATNSKVRGVLKTTEKSATSAGQFVWGGDNNLNGYRAFASGLIPSNLTKGSGTNLSAMIFGNWSDLILAFWSALDILTDPYTGSSSGTVRVVALQDCDIKLRHAESFAKCVDIATA